MSPHEAIQVAKKRFVDSGTFSGVLIFTCGLLMAWGVWATTSIFSHSSLLEKGRELRIQSDLAQSELIKLNNHELKLQRELIQSNMDKMSERLNTIEIYLAHIGGLSKQVPPRLGK